MYTKDDLMENMLAKLLLEYGNRAGLVSDSELDNDFVREYNSTVPVKPIRTYAEKAVMFFGEDWLDIVISLDLKATL